MRRGLALTFAILLIAATAVWTPAAQRPSIASADPASLRFAVIGDAGNGERPQYEIGERLSAARADFPFEFVILLGDNMLGRQEAQDFIDKFQRPYRPLLDAGVRFYAALGNHDKQSNRFYPGFNMGGERYYTFVRQRVRFVVLDTNLLDRKQIAWAEDTLRTAQEPWKIAYFHHPLYSDGGRHGSDVQLRVVLEPIFVKHGVDVVFASHDHIYERIKPQKGITHFVQGAGGQLRKGDLKRSALTAAGFDEDQSFMLVEIAGGQMSFRVMSRTGATVDSGVIGRRPTT